MKSQIFFMLLFQAAFFAIVLFIFRKHIKSGTILIASVSGLLIPFSFIFGMFFGSFDANICYSSVISNLKSASKLAIQSNQPDIQKIYVDGINSITPSGYESQCSLINSAAEGLYESVKSSSESGGSSP
jgi:hypothetical protein